jgi:hypothetical protein
MMLASRCVGLATGTGKSDKEIKVEEQTFVAQAK